jgi:prepilin-type N-terminal cleavage/methylation domain-containing protein
MKRLWSYAGFTLIELIITVSIVALTLALAGPKLQDYTKKQHVKSTARQIYTNLQLARMTAIKENRDVDVSIHLLDDASMSIRRADQPEEDLLAINFHDTSPRIRLTKKNEGISESGITFKPRGTVNGTDQQTIVVRYDDTDIDTEYHVVVSSTGSIRLEKEKGTGG